MAPSAEAAKINTEQEPQKLERARPAKLIHLKSSSNSDPKLSDDRVAELAMLILM